MVENPTIWQTWTGTRTPIWGTTFTRCTSNSWARSSLEMTPLGNTASILYLKVMQAFLKRGSACYSSTVSTSVVEWGVAQAFSHFSPSSVAQILMCSGAWGWRGRYQGNLMDQGQAVASTQFWVLCDDGLCPAATCTYVTKNNWDQVVAGQRDVVFRLVDQSWGPAWTCAAPTQRPQNSTSWLRMGASCYHLGACASRLRRPGPRIHFPWATLWFPYTTADSTGRQETPFSRLLKSQSDWPQDLVQADLVLPPDLPEAPELASKGHGCRCPLGADLQIAGSRHFLPCCLRSWSQGPIILKHGSS